MLLKIIQQLRDDDIDVWQKIKKKELISTTVLDVL